MFKIIVGVHFIETLLQMNIADIKPCYFTSKVQIYRFLGPYFYKIKLNNSHFAVLLVLISRPTKWTSNVADKITCLALLINGHILKRCCISCKVIRILATRNTLLNRICCSRFIEKTYWKKRYITHKRFEKYQLHLSILISVK